MSRLDRTNHLSPDDLAAVTRLLDRAAESGAEPFSDHLLVALHAEHRDARGSDDCGRPARESVFVTLRSDDGHLQMYAQASVAGGSWVVGAVPDPAAPVTGDMLADVLRRVVSGVAALGGGRATWWVRGADESHHRAAAVSGLLPGRVLLQMRRSLPLDVHATVPHRGFRLGVDEEAWLRVNNRAFAGHDEQGGWDRDTLALRTAEPWFDPDGLRVLDDGLDHGIIAFCWTKVHPPRGADPEMGEIYVIGVDPAAHGRGLGRQLTLAGLDHLSGRGIRVGMLYVDAANDTAVHLYTALGFVTEHREFAFTCDVPHRTDIAAST